MSAGGGQSSPDRRQDRRPAYRTTQDGYIAYGIGGVLGHRDYDVNYRVDAPYASINYHLGKIADRRQPAL
ncbi:hypothetical protein ACRAWD_07155 [Caulobacter segnis]